MMSSNMQRGARRGPSLLLISLLALALGENAGAGETLKLCAEADNLPFSTLLSPKFHSQHSKTNLIPRIFAHEL